MTRFQSEIASRKGLKINDAELDFRHLRLCEIYGFFDTQRVGSTVIIYERTLPGVYTPAKCFRQTVNLISGDFTDRKQVQMCKNALHNFI